MDLPNWVALLVPAALYFFAGQKFLHTQDKPEDRTRKTARGVLLIVTIGLLRLGLYPRAFFPALLFLITFKRTLWRYVMYPSELYALLQFKFMHAVPGIPNGLNPSQQYCYEKLAQVSRSFSSVILHLHPSLREAICIFYLVLRGLDTIEDDMKPSKPSKIAELRKFHEHLGKEGWSLKGFGDKPHEIDLLENFHHVNVVYANFKPEYQKVIADITKEMGNGMADYLTKPVVTVADYDKYCYYVAGLVGVGLSRLFAASGLEDASFGDVKSHDLSIQMGLFLQKTNIIRDYLEDIMEANPRMFYPKEIWSKHVPSLESLKDPSYRPQALACLNEMITNALSHANDCIRYMEKLKEKTVFQFCAIPQTMAIATLAVCYNNYRVFQGEVKIGKGEAVKLMLSSSSLKEVLGHFKHYALIIMNEIPPSDPNAALLKATLNSLLETIAHHPQA